VINICHAYSHTLYLFKVGDEEVAWVLTTIWGVSLCFNLQDTCFRCSLYCVTNCVYNSNPHMWGRAMDELHARCEIVGMKY
jgi:hypothetical protein